MRRFRTRTRLQLYPHSCAAEGMDHCYDCAAEVHVLGAYVRRREPGAEQRPGGVVRRLCELSEGPLYGTPQGLFQ